MQHVVDITLAHCFVARDWLRFPDGTIWVEISDITLSLQPLEVPTSRLTFPEQPPCVKLVQFAARSCGCHIECRRDIGSPHGRSIDSSENTPHTVDCDRFGVLA